MTVTTTRIERSGPAVHAALTELSPDEAPRFEQDYRAALSRATDTLDRREADDVLNRWWGIACIRANPLSAEEEELVRRVQAGDKSVLNWLAGAGSSSLSGAIHSGVGRHFPRPVRDPAFGSAASDRSSGG